MSRSIPTLILILLLPAALARAEEPSILERLSEASADVAARADGAIVLVVTAARDGYGVVTGSPPLLVVPYAVAQEFTEIVLDSSDITAERIDGDVGLGVAVYRLPPDKADRWSPLDVEDTWTVRRGNLALSAAPRLELLVVTGVHPLQGALSVGGSADGAVLLSARGRLLGLRAEPEPAYRSYSPWGWQIYGGAPWLVPYAGGGGAQSGANPSTVRRNLGSVYYGQGLIGIGSGQVSPQSVGVPYGSGTLIRGAALGSGTLAPFTYTPGWNWWPRQESVFVPGPVIARVLKDIQGHGRIRHAYVGVVLGTEMVDGVTRMFLSAVLPDSPAEKAGLRQADVIAGVQGHPVVGLAAFERIVALLRPEEVLRVQILGREEEVEVVLGERSDARGRLVSPEDIGIEVVGLTAELVAWLGLPKGHTGVVVKNVQEGSVAAEAGLRRGDVIQQAAGHPTRDAAELEASLASARGDIALVVWHGAGTVDITLSLPEPAAPAEAR